MTAVEKKIEALCLKAEDYREGDKLLTLLSPEGKVFAKVRSVKKPGAKLAIASQPFCFAEYTLSGKSGSDFFTVIGAEPLENFFRCWQDVDCNAVASCICVVADALTREGGDAAAETKLTFQALGAVSYGEGAPQTALLWYLVAVAQLVGADFAATNPKHSKYLHALSMLKWDDLGTLELTPGEVAVLTRVALENLSDFFSHPARVYKVFHAAGI